MLVTATRKVNGLFLLFVEIYSGALSDGSRHSRIFERRKYRKVDTPGRTVVHSLKYYDERTYGRIIIFDGVLVRETNLARRWRRSVDKVDPPQL